MTTCLLLKSFFRLSAAVPAIISSKAIGKKEDRKVQAMLKN